MPVRTVCIYRRMQVERTHTIIPLALTVGLSKVLEETRLVKAGADDCSIGRHARECFQPLDPVGRSWDSGLRGAGVPTPSEEVRARRIGVRMFYLEIVL